VAGLSLLNGGAAIAQEATPSPSPQQATSDPWRSIAFGVTLEGYYEFNANEPPNRVNVLRAYDTRANTFGIQQVATVFELAPAPREDRRFGLRLDLQFGQATETVQGSPANEPRPDVYRHVWQAYGSYVFAVGRGLQVDFGKFASNLGIETNYAKDNQAFSRAYLFNFLPFYHSGLRVSSPVNDRLTLMYTLTNGIQQTEEFNDYKSSQVTAIVKPVSPVTWTINYYFGREQPDRGEPDGPDGAFRVFDTYVTVAPSSRLSLALDVNYVTNEVLSSGPEISLQGLGAYARYQLTRPFGLGVRYERLDDEGLFDVIDQVLQEVTATTEYRLTDGFMVRGEYRRDWSNRNSFPSDGGRRDHQDTFLVGAIWWVGNKAGSW
jgi:hypothetical protein